MISRRDFVKASVLTAAAAIASQSPLLGAAVPPARPDRAMRFGVNYTPRKNWWYCWLDFDRAAIAEDLSGVASLGMDHIRIQCLWPLFQPGIASVSERALANLHSLLDCADAAGLDVEVTVLNGWMSGRQFMPAWVAPLVPAWNGEDFNIFTAPAVIAAEKLLFQRMAAAVGTHRRFLGFDVGNQLGVLQGMGNPVDTKQADAWQRDILSYCDEVAPGRFHVNGVDHTHWYNDFGFSRPVLATTGHATVVHSYIFFDGVLQRYKYNDPASLHLAEYAVELAYAYHTDPARRVWVEETGVGNKEMPEGYKPEFMEHSVRNIASTGKAWGITWWCSHDIDPAIKDFSDYEYGLGLLDLKNKPKPMGKKFAELAAEFKRTPPQAVPRSTALVIPALGLNTKSWPPDWRFAKPYMDLIDKGLSPAIVLESRTKDEKYLKARGITDLVALGQ